MKVEILIYAYLAICVAMILFNIVCIFVFRQKDRNIEKRSVDFTESVEDQLSKETPDEAHKKFLRKKLKKIRHMMAFDETLETLYAQKPEQVQNYIAKLSSVFVFLTFQYGKKNKIQAAYFPYIIQKYKVFKGVYIGVVDSLIELVKEPNLYCRENALQALYSIGDADSVIKALKIVDKSDGFHHAKMITDGLLTFRGDRMMLDSLLWQRFNEFSGRLRLALLDYFRFSSDAHKEKMLHIIKDADEDQELRISAIRYFARHRCEAALDCLYALVSEDSPIWEYKAIAATALGNYPSDKTEGVLKELLCDRNWYVRYNAADSLERLGVTYEEVVDIFEGGDRYASEMLRYRFDRKKLKEGATV